MSEIKKEQDTKKKNPVHHKGNRVNEVLQLPLAPEFEADLREAMDCEDSFVPLVLAVLDLDYFLHINEAFGFEFGDELLISLASYIRDALPDCAKLYRIGGDEFGIIFKNDMEKEDVFLWAEKLRSELALTDPNGAAVTITIGIAAAFDDGASYHELVRKADGAMFRGKFSGRSKVCLAKEEKMVTKTSHYTTDQLQRLTKLSKREGIGEAILLREALDILLKKYDV